MRSHPSNVDVHAPKTKEEVVRRALRYKQLLRAAKENENESVKREDSMAVGTSLGSEASGDRYDRPPRLETITPTLLYSQPTKSLQKLEERRLFDSANRDESTYSVNTREHGILTNIWASIDSETRNLIIATRNLDVMTDGMLAKREREVIENITKFDGTISNAPSYFNDLCAKLGQYPFRSDNAIRIMIGTMTSSAKIWVVATVSAIPMSGEDKFTVVLGKFREHYLTQKHASHWRQILQNTRLRAVSDRYVTMQELEEHYAAFTKVLLNLRMCDREMQQADAIGYYVDSLPSFIYQYLGESSRQKSTLEEVHRAATGAIRSVDITKSATAKEKNVIELNATTTSNSKQKQDSSSNSNSDKAYEEHLKRGAKCYHCGERGHVLDDCEFYKKGKPQTPSGARAYAEINKLRGTNAKYDPVRIIESRNRFRQQVEAALKSRLRKSRHIPDDEEDINEAATNKPASSSSPAASKQQVQHNSMTLIDTWKPGDGEDVDNNEEEQLIQLHNINTEKRDETTSATLCVQVELNGISLGYALVDQGCNKMLIRRSAFMKSEIRKLVVEYPVTNYAVRTASNIEIPIKSRFMSKVTSNNRQFNDQTPIYVVEDLPNRDINCDIVLGRQAIATSKYRLIDTLTGKLLSHKGIGTENEGIQCLAAKCIMKDNRMVIVPKTFQPPEVVQLSALFNGNIDKKSHVKEIGLIMELQVQKQVEIPADVVVSSPSIANRTVYTVELKETDVRRMDQADQSAKINKLRRLVEDRSQMTPSLKMKILHHLMLHAEDIEVCNSNNEIEKLDLSEIYIPEFVNKHHQASERLEDIDESIKEVESIDHPLSPPLQVPITAEYINRKKEAVTKMIRENEHLNDQQQDAMIAMLCKHSDRFSLEGENMERTNTVNHEINTGDTRPFRERLRTYSPQVQEIIDKEVQRMLKEGVIQPSKSPYASNLLLVRKPDPSSKGGVKNRVCASFVQLNKQTVKDSYPLPNIQVIFDKIGNSKWFTTMDLLNGFWQVMIKEEHRHKTAFVTARGLFEFVVMAFGLCNAPATFQRLMDTVIGPEYRSFIETYVDDVMTHSFEFDDHLKHIEILLNILREHNLVVKLTKCKFAQRMVKFLGHILSHKQIKPNPEAVATILKWEKPLEGSNKKKALRGFLGMVGWYRKFIKNFAHTAKPLFNLLKDETKWEWNDECQRAFTSLRDAITTQPVLGIADPNKDYIIDTDSSDYALGAVLQQEDDNKQLHPIAYASRSLLPAEQRYGTTDREALAIPWALEHFNTYCEGHKYTAITDHQALRYMLNNKDKTPRMHRMVSKLSPYEITLYYRPGSVNHGADLLSRESEYMQSKKANDKNLVDMHAMTRSKEKKQSSPLPSYNGKDDDIELVPVVVQQKESNKIKQHRKSKEKLTKEDYIVEKIVDRRLVPNTINEYEYMVKWKGYEDEDNTWQSLLSLKNAMEIVIEYEKERQEKEIGQLAIQREDYICEQCGEQCNNPTKLTVHQWKVHNLPIPSSPQLDVVYTSRELIKTLQEKEVDFIFIYNDINNKEQSKLTKEEQRSLALHTFVKDENDLLYCIDEQTMKSRVQTRVQMRLCVPKQIRKQVMQAVHTGVLAAHPGIVRMMDKMKMYVWWPGMHADIVRYVTQCVTCQKVKRTPVSVLPQAVTLAVRPWQQIGIDAVGPLPKTHRENEYIIDVVCHFTRFVEGWPAPSIDMISISKAVIDRVVCRYGLFERMVSDRGSVFVGTLAAHIYKALRIHRVVTTAYHPQSNGMIERFHSTLKTTLKLWSNEVPEEWDILLPFAIFAYNTSYHTTLQEVPHFLCHGYDARLPIDEVLGNRGEHYGDVHQYAAELVERLQQVHRRVKEILEEVNKQRKEDELLSKILNLQVGDQVWMHDPSTAVGENKKLKTRWTGPYKIIEKKSSVVYVIERNGHAYSVNVTRLKRAYINDENNDNNVEGEKNKQMQIEQLQEEIEYIQQLHRQLIERKQLKQIEIEQLKYNVEQASSVAKTTLHEDASEDDNINHKDDEKVSIMSAVMMNYLYTNTVAWI